MTNAQIIFNAEQELAKEGKIKYTGRVFNVRFDDGTEGIIKETENIHTYATWKQMGFQVQKGQKAVAQIQIWKHTGAKVEEVPTADGEVAVIDKGRMFMKVAHFFSRSQVEAIAE